MDSKESYTLLISPTIVAEPSNVLRDKFMWPEPEIRARVKRFARIADIIITGHCSQRREADPADNHILACAVSGKADVIVSGDKRHLLPLKNTRGYPSSGQQIFSGCLAAYRGEQRHLEISFCAFLYQCMH